MNFSINSNFHYLLSDMHVKTMTDCLTTLKILSWSVLFQVVYVYMDSSRPSQVCLCELNMLFVATFEHHKSTPCENGILNAKTSI